MNADPCGTSPLFDPPDEPPAARPLAAARGTGRPTYTRYRPKTPVRCDDCAAAYVADPGAPMSRNATYRRAQAGTPALLLCHAHVRLRKEGE